MGDVSLLVYRSVDNLLVFYLVTKRVCGTWRSTAIRVTVLGGVSQIVSSVTNQQICH